MCSKNHTAICFHFTTAGIDYTPLDQVIVFNPGQDSIVFYVNITDDLIVEGDEQFEVFLKLSPDSPNVILGNPSVATGIIIDDDKLSMHFIMEFHFSTYSCSLILLYLCYIHTYACTHTHMYAHASYI